MLQDLLPFAVYQWGRLHLHRRNGYGEKEAKTLLKTDSTTWRGLEHLKIVRNGTFSSFTDKAIASIHPIRSTPSASDPNSLVLLNLRDNEVSKISNTTLTFLHLSADSDPTELTAGNGELDGDFSLLYASDIDPTSSNVTLLLKADVAIYFFTYSKSVPNTISYLAADYIFSRNKYRDNDPNYLMVVDKFTTTPDMVALFARLPNDSGSGNNIEIYALCQPIDPQSNEQFCNTDKGGVTIPPALYETPAVWTTRAGSGWPGLLWGMDGENALVGYNLDIDPTPMVMIEKERIILPAGVNSKVTRVELMAVDDHVDYLLVHLGEAGDVLAFKSEGGETFVPELILFGGDDGNDSELFMEAEKTLTSATKGPLITRTTLTPPFSLKSTHPAPFIWKGSPLARTHLIPLSGKDGPVVILGNSEDGGVNWVVAQPETIGRLPYIPSMGESLSYIAPSNLTLPHLPLPSFQRIIESSSTTPSIIAPIPTSTFVNALNVQKGKVELSLMLIPEIGFRIDYSGGAMRPPKKTMDVPLIGEGGWNSRRPTWIGMDPGSSASRWDASYFLILNYKVYPLKETTVWDDYPDDTDPTTVTRTFTVKPAKKKGPTDDMVITYREDSQIWVVSGDKTNLQFGGTGAVRKGWNSGQWNLDWTPRAMEWALVKSSVIDPDDPGNTIMSSFTYAEVTGLMGNNASEGEEGLGPRPYTKALLPYMFVSSNGGLVNWTWDTTPGQERLQSFKLILSGRSQSVQFHYDPTSAMLSQISQTFGDPQNPTTLLEFGYDTEYGLISSIAIPERGLQLRYSYEKLQYAKEDEKIVMKIPAINGAPPATAHGVGMSYFDNGESLFAWNAGDGTWTDLAPLVGDDDDQFNNYAAYTVTLAAKDNCVFRLITGDKDFISVWSIIPTDSSPWSFKMKKQLPSSNRATLLPSGLLVLLYPDLDNANVPMLQLEDWRDGDSPDKKDFLILTKVNMGGDSLPAAKNVTILDDRVVWRTTDRISWVMRGLGGKWWTSPKYFNADPRLKSCSDFFASTFDLGSKGESKFRDAFDPYRLQMDGQAMGIFQLGCFLSDEPNNVMTSSGVMYELTSTGQLVETQYFQQSFEKITDIDIAKPDKLSDDTPVTIHFKYSPPDEGTQRYQISIEVDDHSELNKNATRKFREDNDKHDDRAILFNPRDRLLYLLPQGRVAIGGPNKTEEMNVWVPEERILSTSGYSRIWDKQMMTDQAGKKFDLILSNNFEIKRADENGPIQLLQGERMVFDFGNNASQLMNQYPGYLVSTQSDPAVILYTQRIGGSDVEVVEEDGIRRYVEGTYLRAQSSPQFLVSTLASGDQTRIEWTGWLPWKPAVVVSRMEIQGGPEQDVRVTRLEYTAGQLTADRDVVWNNVTMIKGNSAKESAGWTVFTFDPYKFNATSGYVRQLYDGDGNWLKQMEQNNDDTQNGTSTVQKLWDKTGSFPVTTLTPFNSTECQIGYVAFQPYESWGGSCGWQFDNSSVFHSDAAETDASIISGDHYLSLTHPGEVLTFDVPLVKGRSYVAGCWTRSKALQGDKTSSDSPILTAWVGDQGLGFMSKVVFTRSMWNYLQVKVIAEELLPLWDTLLDKKIDIDKANLTLNFRVEPSDPDLGVDVDSCLVAPLSWNSEIAVFDAKMSRVSEKVLGVTGLVVNYVYDDYLLNGEAIVTTDPMGRVTRMQFNVDGGKTGGPSVLLVESTDISGWIHSYGINDGTPVPSSLQTFGRYGLLHSSDDESSIDIFKDDAIPPDRFMLRFAYHLAEPKSSLTLNLKGRLITLERNGDSFSSVIRSPSGEEKKIPQIGTILIGSLPGNRIFVFSSDSGVLFETDIGPATKTTLSLQMSHTVAINHLIILPNPTFALSHLSPLGEELQTMAILDDGFLLKETLYDEQGRAVAATTPTHLSWSTSDMLLAYRSGWVTDFSLQDQTMAGQVVDLNPSFGGVPFTSLEFGNTPPGVNEWVSEGRPGADFSAKSRYAISYSKEGDPGAEVLFPPENGFYYKTKVEPGEFRQIFVFSGSLRKVVKGNPEVPVATITRSPGGWTTLMTNNYDEKGRLIATLPPMYHFQQMTLLKGKTWAEIGYDRRNAPFGIFYDYDDKGKLIRKVTPELGVSDNIYGANGKTAFVMRKATEDDDTAGNLQRVVYFDYADGARISEFGVLQGWSQSGKNFTGGEKQPSKQLKYLGSVNGALSTTDFVFNYSPPEVGEAPYVQMIENHLLNKLPSSETHLSWKSSNDSTPLLTPTVRYTYTPKGDKLLKIHYATQATTLAYSYNALGFMNKVFLVRDDTEPALLANFEYSSSTGGVAIERIFHTAEPPSKGVEVPPLTTSIEYNSPGYPTSWENSFFKEEISYTHPGYGDVPMGQPAYPTALNWTGKWGPAKTITPERIAESTGLSLSSSTTCHTALIAAGYLDMKGYILRHFVPVLDVENLPIICNFGEYSWGIEKLMGSIASLRGYGYSFQYGNYKELLKAKFYDPRDVTERPYCTTPLTLDTLQNALGKPQDAVKNLWRQLGDKNYILEDSDKGRSGISHGEAGISLLNGGQMTADLSNLISGDTLFEYAEPIGRVLGTRIGKSFGKNEFSDIFVKWQEKLSNQTDVIVDTIWSMFSKQGYLDTNGAVTSKVLDAGFSSIVSSIQNLDVSTVFKTLLDFFLCGVSTSAQDIQVYESDMHGNMELFYNGQDRLNLTYKAGTNQILGSVLTPPSGKTESRTYTHDINGNLNSISQDGAVILDLTYDSLTNRPTLIKLLDGTELRFAYDYKGERVFKKVFDKNGQLIKEIRYLGRDLDGKVLTDQVLTYSSPTLPPKVVTTSYFYGPRGLFGFLRDGTYYTVLVDRIGSPRLILRNGEIVDGYNYLPYGKVSSTWKLGNVENHGTVLRYLFTGQELDEEIGLYNFHFRMYDPKLGRFYQVDPDEQYYSPYKYAGNSPILMVDPDGRFGFIIFFIALGLGLLFGYLGMAAANGTWDPTKWHWDKWQTWVAGIIGFVSGFLLPYGFEGTASALVEGLEISATSARILTVGLGLAGAYLSAAANFNDFNFADWDWSSPGAWNALFNGFAFGSTIVGGVKDAYVFFTKLDSTVMRALLVGGSTLTGVGLAYISGVMANQLDDGTFEWNLAKWNWNGATFFAVTTGGLGGATLPVGLIGTKEELVGLFRNKKASFSFTRVGDDGQEIIGMSYVRRESVASIDTTIPAFDDFASLFSEGIEALQDTVRNDDALIDNTDKDLENLIRNINKNLPLSPSIIDYLNMKLEYLSGQIDPQPPRSFKLNAPKNLTDSAIFVFLANNDYILLQGIGKGFHPDGGVYLFNSTSNPDLFNKLAESTGHAGTIPVGNLTVDIANFLNVRNTAAITAFMTIWGNAVRSELVKIAGVEPSLDSAAFQEEVLRRLMHAINSQPKPDLSKNEVVNWIVMTAMEGSLRDVLLNPLKEQDANNDEQLVDVLGRMGQLVAGSNIAQIIASNQTASYTDIMLPLTERWDVPTSCVQSSEICVNGPPEVEVGSVPFLTSFKIKPENHIVPNSVLANDGLVRGMNVLDMVDFTNVSHVDPLLEKLTSFDGLDGFCYFDNVTSCPSKKKLGDESLENEAIVTNRIRRSAREEQVFSATSSSSSLHGSNIIGRGVKLIRGLWGRISPAKTVKSHRTPSDILFSKTKPQNQAGSPSIWNKCVPWAHDGLGYVDGFTCMGNKGVVSVVPLSHEAQESNPTSLMTTDYGDTYRDCTFYRDPTRPFGSAHCTGNKSQIHYTSWVEQRPFDHLNDHLLILALILHFIQVSKDDDDEVKSDQISTDDEKMTMWRQTLDDIANMLEFLAARNDADQWCGVWGRRLLQDRNDDWDAFYRKGSATLEEFEIFKEDLGALCEEVGELVDNAMKLL